MRYIIFSLTMLSLIFVSACRTMTPAEKLKAEKKKRWEQKLAQLEQDEIRRLEEKGRFDITRKIDASKLFVMAQVDYDKGNYREALGKFAILAARHGDTDRRAGAQSHLAIGDCMMQLKQYDFAIEAYHAAITGYPEDSKEHLGYIKLGDAYAAAGIHDRAFRYYYLARLLYKDAAVKNGVNEKIKKARADHVKQLASNKK